MKNSITECHTFPDVMKLQKHFRTAISLHSHTLHSKEGIRFVYYLSERSPAFSRIIEKRIIDHWKETGKIIDFNRIHWTPPVLPTTLYNQEANQITHLLELNPYVSITDHDCIEGCLELGQKGLSPKVPISLEWTVPYMKNCFHLGVHNLPQDQANVWIQEFRRYTRRPNRHLLAEILLGLNCIPETLLVLNHPLWDIAHVGQKYHRRILRNFWSKHGLWIHALELNGFRSPSENSKVLDLGEELDVPVLSGGDRHGWQANSVLNLSQAETFPEFVCEVRFGRHSTILMTPASHESLLARTIETVEEAIRKYPKSCGNQQLWTDRVFIETDFEGIQPLSIYWRAGGPWWVRTAMSIVRILGCPQIRPALRWALAGKDSTV